MCQLYCSRAKNIVTRSVSEGINLLLAYASGFYVRNVSFLPASSIVPIRVPPPALLPSIFLFTIFLSIVRARTLRAGNVCATSLPGQHVLITLRRDGVLAGAASRGCPGLCGAFWHFASQNKLSKNNFSVRCVRGTRLHDKYCASKRKG